MPYREMFVEKVSVCLCHTVAHMYSFKPVMTKMYLPCELLKLTDLSLLAVCFCSVVYTVFCCVIFKKENVFVISKQFLPQFCT